MMSSGEFKRYSIIVYNLPEDYNEIGILNEYFSKYGNIQKVNCDLERKSAMVKFKEIHEAESAASAYFNKRRDDYVMGLPQVKIKYVLNPGVAPGCDGGDSPDNHRGQQPQLTPEQLEAQKRKRLME